MKLDQVHRVYFLGIGGIGMSALARWFNTNGYKVAGYDKTPSVLTDELQKEGMSIHFEDNIDKIAPEYKFSQGTLVVFTPAIPKDHSEWKYFRDHNFEIQKRSQVLGIITEKMFTVAVAGTHGKTTTSSMVAHVLKYSGKNTAAFLGGITQNYHTNLLLNDASRGDAMVVVEADEYDRSFLTLHPDVAVVNAMDPDHLDIYGTEEEFVKAFNDFVKLIKPSGKLFYKYGASIGKAEQGQVHKSFGDAKAEYRAENIRVEKGAFWFDIISPEGKHKDFTIQLPGYHNVNNAVAAFSVGKSVGLSEEQIKNALADFKGVKRRFEYYLKSDNKILIDDYAHHPEELRVFCEAVKTLYPRKKFLLIFQPHLFSRTKDFMEGFAKSLSMPDELWLLDIYPARELPIPGITSQALLEKVTLKNKRVIRKEEIVDEASKNDAYVIAMVGAGDIDRLIPLVKESLEKKYV